MTTSRQRSAIDTAGGFFKIFGDDISTSATVLALGFEATMQVSPGISSYNPGSEVACECTLLSVCSSVVSSVLFRVLHFCTTWVSQFCATWVSHPCPSSVTNGRTNVCALQSNPTPNLCCSV